MTDTIDKKNAVIAALVTLTAFVVYYLTKAPTLSFWDCGEFIDVSYTLGIPHPPGTPLYVMLGRIFTLLPISTDIAVRVNLLSATSSAGAALFAYLASINILKKALPKDNQLLTMILTYGGAVCGSLIMAFSLTHWNNSVEAEVYGLAMLLFMAIFYLALRYYDSNDRTQSTRLMLLTFLLAFLGVGVHLTTFLIIPAVSLIFIIKKEAPRHVWFTIAGLFLFELYLIFAFSSRPGEIPYYIPVLIVYIFFLFFMFSFDVLPKLYVYTALAFLPALLPLVGVILEAVNGGNQTALIGQLTTIGAIAFGLLNLFGLWLLVTYFRNRDADNSMPTTLLPAIFILLSGLMVLLLYPLHGFDAYKPFLVISAILGGIILFLFREHIKWSHLIAVGAISVVIIAIKPFFYAMAIALAILFIGGKTGKLPNWRNGVLIILVAVIGFSAHLYIPIRSSQNPKINENNPSSSLQATIDFIERKQYGSMSMTKRMFKRRAEWLNQFGDYQRMGFWRFFNEQYGMNGRSFIILFIVGLFGVWEIVRRKPKNGLPLLVLLFLTTVGLILYMNFADGNRQDPVTGRGYLEVRERDYFFTPGYMLFALAIGYGLTFLIQFMRETLKNNPGLAKGICYPMLAMFALPVVTLTQNYHYADRTGNFIAYDYAYNLLNSCEPNAIYFVGGDNDTFPLWCIQDVYGIRPDVSIVNLALSNTKWYLKQLKTNLNVTTNWTDAQIDALRPFRDQYGNVNNYNDQMISQVIKHNYGKRPINFCVTVPGSDRRYMGRSIDSLIELNGMAWWMTRESKGLRKNIENTIDLYQNKFQYRGIADKSVYKNESTLRLTKNFPQSIMQVADSLRILGEIDSTISIMKDAIEKVPYSTKAINYLVSVYQQYGRLDELRRFISESEFGDIPNMKTRLAQTLFRKGPQHYREGENILWEVTRNNPTYRPPMDELLRFYYESRQREKFREIIEHWLKYNPNDEQIDKIYRTIDREFDKLESNAGDQ